MENTCVLSVLPVTPNWKVYNLPSKRSVKYCFILKKKREFQTLMENALGRKHPKTNSCSIVDKRVHVSKNANVIEVIFLNGTENCLLSLNLYILEKYILRRRNNLLVFLKNCEKEIGYQIQNDNIYLKCDSELQWKIFYSLFEFLLLRYGLSIIGAAFYNSLISECMLMQEKSFLYLITMESRRPCEPDTLSDQRDCADIVKGNFSNVEKEKSKNIIVDFDQNNFGQTCVSLSSQEFSCEIFSNTVLKRKSVSDDILSGCHFPKQKVRKLKQCFCGKKLCKCHETEWRMFRSVKRFSVNSYMDILLTKGVLSDTELHLSKESKLSNSLCEPFAIPKLDVSLNNDSENFASTSISKKPLPVHSSKEVARDFFQDEKLLSSSKNIDSPATLCQDEHLEMNTDETNRLTANKHSINVESNKSLNTLDPVTRKGEGKENMSFLFEEFTENESKCAKADTFAMFQTASGKKVNISETALKAAEQMFLEVLQSDSTSDNDNLNFTTVKRESSIKKHNFKNTANSSTYNAPRLSENLSGEKYVDERIDGVLADKIFEEISFDEKDAENCSETLLTQSSSSFADNLCDRTSSCGKVRKSLGGRRSLKPYSARKPSI